MNDLFGKNSRAASSGAVYSAAVCLYIVLSLIVSLIISGAGLTGDAAAYLGYICSPVAIALALFFAVAVLKIPVRDFVPKKCRPKYIVIAFLAIFGLLFAVSPLNTLFVNFLTELGYVPVQSSLPSLEGGGMAGAIIVVAVLPAVCEELLFRGAILRGAEEGAGTAAAVLLSAVLFMLYHGSVEQTIYQFICGCVFALMAVRSASVLPSMLAHFVNNAVIIVFEGTHHLDDSGALMLPQWLDIMLTVLAALSFAAALVLLFVDKKPRIRGSSAQVKVFLLWAAVGIFVMALLWVLGLFSL